MSNDQFTPPPAGSHDQGPRITREDLKDTSRLRRVVDGRQFGGVAAGVARYFDVDPTVVRVIWAVSALFGVGLLAYIALWVILPEDGATTAPFGLDERNRGILVAGIAVLAAFGLLGNSWGWFDLPWPLLVVGGIAALVLSRRNQSAPVSPDAPTHAAPTPGQSWDGSSWVSSGSWKFTDGPRGPGQYWVPPTGQTSRKRGPLLFGWTLLLVMVVMVGMAAFGVSTWSAYPAAALAVVGAMLTLGAFWGRAGGLILVGLLLVPTLGLARAGEVVSDETVTWRPTTAAQVEDSYHRDFGRVTLDLSQVTNPEDLAGRTIELSVDLGSARVILPHDASWNAEGSVDLGRLRMDGHELNGPDINWTTNHEVGAAPDSFGVDVQVDLGTLTVTTQSQPQTTNGADR